VASETILTNEVFAFADDHDAIIATIYYIAAGNDCSNAADVLTYNTTIYPKRAHFNIAFDKELGSLATFKRVLRSTLDISENSIEMLGNLRFFWDFDDKMIPAPEVGFDPSDPTLGQYPNVYYTFPDGGAYEITLKVVDITTPLDTAAYTKIVQLHPVFGNDRVDFENIPNVFTPGGTNNNYFKVETAGTNKLSFKVFSRTGALVYEYEGNVIKWDGKNYYGQDLPQGIYYYLLDDISAQKRYNPAKGFFYIYR
jgi:gliding motility-associated-like protein